MIIFIGLKIAGAIWILELGCTIAWFQSILLKMVMGVTLALLVTCIFS